MNVRGLTLFAATVIAKSDASQLVTEYQTLTAALGGLQAQVADELPVNGKMDLAQARMNFAILATALEHWDWLVGLTRDGELWLQTANDGAPWLHVRVSIERESQQAAAQAVWSYFTPSGQRLSQDATNRAGAIARLASFLCHEGSRLLMPVDAERPWAYHPMYRGE